MALNALVLTEEGKETYVVDCGSTCHMIRKNNPQMVILETTSSSSVGFADGSQIHSSGTCKIEFRDNRPFDLKEALIVPIDYNLLSTHVLARECGSLTILGVTVYLGNRRSGSTSSSSKWPVRIHSGHEDTSESSVVK